MMALRLSRYRRVAMVCLFAALAALEISAIPSVQAQAAGTSFVGITGTFTRERFLTRDSNVVTIPAVAELPGLYGIEIAPSRRAGVSG